MLTSRVEAAGRLAAFVSTVGIQPVFRRSLRYQPKQALAEFGFAVEGDPGSLPVRHYETNVWIDDRHLFGPEVHRQVEWAGMPVLAVRLVAYGVKPMALIHGPEAALTRQCAWALEHSLAAILSPHEFTPRADAGKGGFANLAAQPRPARAGSGAWRGLLITADWNQAMLGWLSLLYGWDNLLGACLGYPACCVEAYGRRWNLASSHHQGDLVPLLLDEHTLAPFAGCFDWRVNILRRYFGEELIQHFPCRLDCPASLAAGRRYEAALRRFEPRTAVELRDKLALPVIFTEGEGVFLFPGGELVLSNNEPALSYEPGQIAATTENSPAARHIRAAGEIRAGPGRLHAGAAEIEGRLVVFQ